MIRYLLAAAIVAFTVPAIHAQDCEDMQDQAEMSECVQRAYEASDAELNSLYGQIERRLSGDPDTKDLFVQSERAWVRLRDAQCAFETSVSAGGSIHPMLQATCLDDLTQRRIEDFQGYLSCEEGDLSCPVPPAS